MKTELIIETPSLQSLRQRYTYALLTLLFWVFWFYLWVPLISLVAWLLGIENFYDQMVVKAGLEAFLELAGFYLTVIAILGLSLTGWGRYNQLRFRGKEKRTHQPHITNDELAVFFKLSEETVTRLQAADRITLEHDIDGTLVRTGPTQKD